MIPPVCPYLGIKGDPESHHAAPSIWNCCHHARPLQEVELDHQALYCLTEAHTACPVYQRLWKGRLPAYCRSSYTAYRSIKPLVVAGLLLTVFVLAVFALPYLSGLTGRVRAGWSQIEPPRAQQQAGRSSLATPLPASLPPPATATLPAAPSEALLLAATNPPEPTGSGLVLPGVELVIHEVKEGESLSMLALSYHTTVEAIQALNFSLPSPLWVGWKVVVPVGTDDVTGLPAFELQFTAEQVAVADLARQTHCDEALLRLYNGWGEQALIPAGQWVLLPRQR